MRGREGLQRGACEWCGISPRDCRVGRRGRGKEVEARRGTEDTAWWGSRVPWVPGPAPPGFPFLFSSGGGGAGPAEMA